MSLKWFCILLISVLLQAKDISLGTTVPFAEKNAVKEIKDYIANNKELIESKTNADKEKAITKFKESYRPANAVDLPRSTHNETYLVDVSQELERDIMNAKGEVLYPKGLRINPLNFVKMPFKIVIIDATDKKQLQWAKDKGYAAQFDCQIHITKGKPWELSEELKRPIFFTNKKIVDRFSIKSVPSIVEQAGNKMKITTFDVWNK